jgi:hypothetical protein
MLFRIDLSKTGLERLITSCSDFTFCTILSPYVYAVSLYFMLGANTYFLSKRANGVRKRQVAEDERTKRTKAIERANPL